MQHGTRWYKRDERQGARGVPRGALATAGPTPVLRQLWRLRRDLELGGRAASAPAIYAETHGAGWTIEDAKESGYEGVACVDDAARLAVLLLRAHERFGAPWALPWAERTLEFVLHLQQPDGNMANFILDWDGAVNLTGPTSAPNASAWLARGLWALAAAYRVTGLGRYRERYDAALAHAVGGRVDHMDIAAVVAFSLLEMRAAGDGDGYSRRLTELCDQIACCRRDGVLLNHPSESTPHLWNYLQPAALARASVALGHSEWLEPASEAATRVLEPVVAASFDAPRTMPFDVSCTVENLVALHIATGDRRWAELAALGRLWFHGRNPAGLRIYDRRLGIVYDGVDEDRVNRNSGAESNIEGAFALFHELPWEAYGSRGMIDVG